ncbi:MAG TPA: ABC transporter permease subunit [Candidatus Eisenbergiella merdavium]|uniref:ABC transporter permease subunit n=1 Tax=Candidatus Eisenbergiella merdavium TaxID=2838551 RepID=A0A9D2NG28_9FIRM|nr:ABC transporter permease subunit [Candidatus Eisenbergiella merdavium]
MKSASKQKKKSGGLISGIKYDIRHNPYLCLLCVPAILWFCIFAYSPLVYLLTAFQRYRPTEGLWGSEFIGLMNFKAFFGSSAFFQVTFNTIFLNALFIISSMAVSILIAIALSEVNGRLFKKATQSIVILPHFISWTVIALLCEALLKTQNGFINNILVSLGMEKINFYQNADVWPALLVFLRIWQGAGYGSIVYLATIAGLDQEMFEAARVDGATRGQCIRYLTLPLLKSTAVMLFIMNVGKIFNGDFGMIYNLVGSNSLLYRTTDVIDTYVYRMLVESTNIGQSAAVSFYQSVMGFVIVLATNALTRKLDPDSALF